MVSKKNQAYRQQHMAEQTPHYGLRKLSVGLASVLLSTSLYLGLSETASADTVQPDQGTAGTEQNALNSGNHLTAGSVSLSTSSQPVIAAQTASNANREEDFRLNGSELNPSQNKNISLSIKVANNQAGDDYRIHIEGGAYLPNPVAMPSNYGQMTVKQNADYSVDVDYKLTSSVTLSQDIAFLFDGNYSKYNLTTAKLFNAGTSTKQITIFRNDELIKTLAFEQVITPSLAPSWQRTFPDPNATKKLAVDNDYTWTLNLGERTGVTNQSDNDLLSKINHQTTIVVPTPASFVLNTAKSKENNPAGVTISQDGIGRPVTIVIAPGTDLKNVAITGHFQMTAPKADTTVAGSSPITISQDVGAAQPLTATAGIFQEIIWGTDSNKPVGELLQTDVGGAYAKKTTDNVSYDHEIPQTSSHDILSLYNYAIENIAPTPLNNVHLRITVPDGVATTGFDLPTITGLGTVDYLITLRNGQTQTGTVANGGTIDLSKLGAISQIELTLSQLPVGEPHSYGFLWSQNGIVGVFKLKGYVADKYSNGSAVQVGDHLISKLYAGVDGTVGTVDRSADQVVVATAKDQLMFSVSASNYNHNPGANGGAISISDWYARKAKDPVFYIVLPNNATSTAALLTASLRAGASKPQVNVFHANGRTIVKLDYTGIQIKGENDDRLNLTNLPDVGNSTQPWSVYVMANNAKIMDFSGKELPTVTNAELPFVENNSTAVKIGSGTWTTQVGQGTSTIETAQGNLDYGLQIQGNADDKGSSEMTYAATLGNHSNRDLTNVRFAINLPHSSDNSQSFTFQLTAPAQVIDLATGQLVAGAVISYSNTPSDLNNPTTANYTDGYNAQTRSVLVALPNVPQGSDYRVVLAGIDPTLATDAGKTGELHSVTWTEGNDELKPFIVNSAATGASQITVTGKSVVKVQFHYHDASGDHYVDAPSLTQTLTDNQDRLNLSAGQVSAALTKAQQAGQISPRYQLTNANEPQVVINSQHGDYANGAENGSTALGQLAQYYFDGDTLVYDLATEQQQARLKLVDDTDPANTVNLPVLPVAKGEQDTSITFANLAQTIENLVNERHYQVASINDDTNNKQLSNGGADWSTVFGNYDAISGNLQDFTIHLVHQTSQETEKRTVHLTVHYQYGANTGSLQGHQIYDDQSPAAASFQRTKTTDLVTGTSTVSAWTPNSQTFASVTSPMTIKGYTPDQAQVSGIQATPESQELEKTVYYTADPQAAQLKFYDDTTGQYIPGVGEFQANGYTNGKIAFGSQVTDTYQQLTDNTKGGYTYVGTQAGTDPTKGSQPGGAFADYDFGQYDSVADNGLPSQTFIVHLKHTLVPVDHEHPFTGIVTDKTVQRDVVYRFSDGSNHDQEVQDFFATQRSGKTVNPIQTARFTGTGHVDLVLTKAQQGQPALVKVDNQGNELVGADGQPLLANDLTWFAVEDGQPSGKQAQTLPAITSPTIAGYHVATVESTSQADGTNVKATSVTAISPNVHVTVTYTPNSQTAGLSFYDDTTGTVIPEMQDLAKGVSNGKIAFANGDASYQQLIKQGYRFVKAVDNTDSKQPVTLTSNADDYQGIDFGYYDRNDSQDQAFVVHLVHGSHQVTDQRTVSETIHYVYGNGPQQGQTASGDYLAKRTISRIGTVDEVTDQISYGPWDQVPAFSAVSSPEISGYTADRDEIPEQEIQPDSADIELTVKYLAIPVPATGSQGSSVKANLSDSTGLQAGLAGSQAPTKQLPQTGSQQSSTALGLAFLSLGTMLGAFGLGKRKHD
ncbi:mucin-binding protein [Limosilactobacillus antri]|uniref:mucin-binding protein n=1 Tax=Limosilactobacillus antri TaxID=227943 RepID=UPI001F58653B|nr:YSIRK-type signal peptide-containing protein [Limosilactobacillus antri]